MELVQWSGGVPPTWRTPPRPVRRPPGSGALARQPRGGAGEPSPGGGFDGFDGDGAWGLGARFLKLTS